MELFLSSKSIIYIPHVLHLRNEVIFLNFDTFYNVLMISFKWLLCKCALGSWLLGNCKGFLGNN